jgi:hypothetical protein
MFKVTVTPDISIQNLIKRSGLGTHPNEGCTFRGKECISKLTHDGASAHRRDTTISFLRRLLNIVED